jgi:hypothetical protein
LVLQGRYRVASRRGYNRDCEPPSDDEIILRDLTPIEIRTIKLYTEMENFPQDRIAKSLEIKPYSLKLRLEEIRSKLFITRNSEIREVAERLGII